jgi:hypothetical protein
MIDQFGVGILGGAVGLLVAITIIQAWRLYRFEAKAREQITHREVDRNQDYATQATHDFVCTCPRRPYPHIRKRGCAPVGE